MNTNLKEVQKELDARKREVKRLEREARTMKIQGKLDIFSNMLANDETASKFLAEHTNEEVKVVADTFVSNFEMMLESASEKLETVHKKKAKRQARKNTRNADRNNKRNDNPIENGYEIHQN